MSEQRTAVLAYCQLRSNMMMCFGAAEQVLRPAHLYAFLTVPMLALEPLLPPATCLTLKQVGSGQDAT